MSHAAIMAKTMNIPALLEIDTDSEWDGRQAIVDGYTGTLYIDPDEEVKKEYEIRRQADQEEREELLKFRERTGSHQGWHERLKSMPISEIWMT